MSDKAVKCPQCQMPIEQIKAALKHEEQNNQEAEQTNPDRQHGAARHADQYSFKMKHFTNHP